MKIDLKTIVAVLALVIAAVSGFFSWQIASTKELAELRQSMDKNDSALAGRIGKGDAALLKRIEAIEGRFPITPAPGHSEAIADLGRRVTRVELALQERPIVPSGVVVASLRPCAGVWEPYGRAAGRFLVGAGKGTEGSLVDEVYVGQLGGAEFVELLIDHLPRHQHDTMVHADPAFEQNWGRRHSTDNVGWDHTDAEGISTITIPGARKYGDGRNFTTGPVGDGNSLRTVPPFVALHICKLKAFHAEP